MSFATISIHRTLPVINGYVAVPDDSFRNQITKDEAVAAVPGASAYRVTSIRDPYVVELPGQNPSGAAPDYFGTLRDL